MQQLKHIIFQDLLNEPRIIGVFWNIIWTGMNINFLIHDKKKD